MKRVQASEGGITNKASERERESESCEWLSVRKRLKKQECKFRECYSQKWLDYVKKRDKARMR